MNKYLLKVVKLSDNTLTSKLLEELKIDNKDIDKYFEQGKLYTIISNTNHDDKGVINYYKNFSVLKIVIIAKRKNRCFMSEYLNPKIIKRTLNEYFYGQRYVCNFNNGKQVDHELDKIYEYKRIMEIYDNL